MRRTVCFILYIFQVHIFLRYVNRRKVVILAYHGFTDIENPPGIENYQGKHLNIKRFRCQVRYLAEHFNVITLDQFIQHHKDKIKIPNNSVIITIDDGYESNYTLAFTVLKELKLPVSIFLTTDFIDNKEYLWPDKLEYALNYSKFKELEVTIANEEHKFLLDSNIQKCLCHQKIRAKLKSLSQELRNGAVMKLEDKLGVTLESEKGVSKLFQPLTWQQISQMLNSKLIAFGSHTHSHVIVSKCKHDHMEQELVLSKDIIENKTASHCETFAYPNGAIGDFNDETKTLLEKCGYNCGLTTLPGHCDNSSDLFQLKRVLISNKMSHFEFAVNLHLAHMLNRLEHIIKAILLQIKQFVRNK